MIILKNNIKMILVILLIKLKKQIINKNKIKQMMIIKINANLLKKPKKQIINMNLIRNYN